MGIGHRDYAPTMAGIDRPDDSDERKDIMDTPTTNPTADQADTEQRTRRRRVASVEIPEAIHAMATLTGQDAGDIIERIVAAEVANIQAKAKAALVIGAAK